MPFLLHFAIRMLPFAGNFAVFVKFAKFATLQAYSISSFHPSQIASFHSVAALATHKPNAPKAVKFIFLLVMFTPLELNTQTFLLNRKLENKLPKRIKKAAKVGGSHGLTLLGSKGQALRVFAKISTLLRSGSIFPKNLDSPALATCLMAFFFFRFFLLEIYSAEHGGAKF